jgi:glutamate carboxypeptidase
LAAAELVIAMSQPFDGQAGITINCGRIEGGGPLNVVPDLCIARFNARATTGQEQSAIEQRIEVLTEAFSRRDGIAVEVHGGFHAPPRPLDRRSQKLLEDLIACGREVGLDLTARPTGGASDGNRLAAAGMPVIDSLGPVGADLHSPQERVDVPSLVQRARLVALFLMKLASGEIPPP